MRPLLVIVTHIMICTTINCSSVTHIYRLIYKVVSNPITMIQTLQNVMHVPNMHVTIYCYTHARYIRHECLGDMRIVCMSYMLQ